MSVPQLALHLIVPNVLKRQESYHEPLLYCATVLQSIVAVVVPKS